MLTLFFFNICNIYINPLSSRIAGQAILTKYNVEDLEHKTVTEGRLHILKIKVLAKVTSLINEYGPNHDNERMFFLSKLKNILETYDY